MSQAEPKEQIINRLQSMVSYAHAPYSHVQICALLRDEDGNLHPGVNVENAVYPLGSCAEASAISHLITQGKKRILEVWIFRNDKKIATPCGGCRQRLAEFADLSCPIHCYCLGAQNEHYTLAELLPHTFRL